jgi:hypothetical protein
MSAINDALKRARRDRPAGVAPAAGPGLRPVEGQTNPGGVSFIVLLLLFNARRAVAGSFLWIWYKSGKTEIRARNAVAVTPPPTVVPATPQSAPVQAPVRAAPVAIAPTVSVPASTDAPVANVAVTPLVEAPKSATQEFKLQGIFYRTQNPSAVVNRQTVFLGSTVDGARVAAIDRDSVTIVITSGQSKVLVLSQ